MTITKQWLLSRLKEQSTWKGLSLMAGATGAAISPELINQIGLVVGAVWGLIDMVRKEH
ncbi:hypothetical protein [Azohydromonas lata]|uniref:Holin n=1 Tax=Azohydromonas lata TaxID=45677 RepID=A0ABU5ID16_9BURK|nr:hypothetical protein [Azohydromonas lata]MDZ5457007.1 hypothetical protein [Azohydromonas lata]